MTTSASAAGPRDPTSEPHKILVVDDDGATRDTLAVILRREGYDARFAENGTEALGLLDVLAFDVAFVDVKMPGVDGPDLLPLLFAKQPSLYVVIVTGDASVDVAIRSLRAGAADFIEKPVRLEWVRKTLSRALERRQLDRTTALYRSSQTIFDAQNFDRLPEAIVNVAMQVMSADAASLLLPTIDGKLYVAHAYGLDADVANTVRITIGEGIAGRVALSRRPTIINGSASEHAEFSGETPRRRIKSSIVYPLVSGSRLVGMLTFNRLTNQCPFNQEDVDHASVLASQVLLALENMRLAQQTAISERLAAVGQLAAGVAHEINTPLQFVGDGLHFLGQAVDDLFGLLTRYEELAADCETRLPDLESLRLVRALHEEIDVQDLREEVPKALQRTKDGISRVTTIVRSVKSFGRPDAISKEPTDLARLIEATLTVARGEYKYVADVETGLDEIPPVMAHPGELSQVFLNLVVNAAHAISEKAEASGSTDRGTIRVCARACGDSVEVSVEDTGCGIPPELCARIFDPFFTTKPVGRGTGLGLSIARGIVADKHGGELTVESEVGRGSRFLVRLPIHHAS
jgi:two-component system NtrC family sensor kinase